MSHTIIDKRGVEPPKEPCRVCGAPVIHSREYNKPTMDCIKYLRGKIAELEGSVAKLRTTSAL